MVITHTINTDLSRRPVPETVPVMQGDANSRNVAFKLLNNGLPWTPPDGTTAVIRYLKPDGTGGSYDTMPDGDPAAWSIVDNTLTISLAPQVLTVPGNVHLTAALISGEAEIHTFTTIVQVMRNPGYQAVSEDYYKIRGSLPDSGWTPNKYLATDADGNVIVVDAPKGGVQTINGVGPDESGNVAVTINALAPPATAQVGQYLRVKSVSESGQVTAVEAVDIDAESARMYAYNGWELPAPPVWDQSKYPKTAVSVVDTFGISFHATFWAFTDFAVSVGASTGDDVILYTNESAIRSSIEWSTATDVPAEWPVLAAPDIADGNIALDYVKWANTDIYKTDGTLYLSASEPVPVYNGDTDAGVASIPVIDLETLIPNDGTPVTLTDSEGAAFAAASAAKMPCVVRLYSGDSEGAVIYVSALAMYVANVANDGEAIYQISDNKNIFHFGIQDGTWAAIYTILV